MKLPPQIEKEIQAVEHELESLYRRHHYMLAGPTRLRALRSVLEDYVREVEWMEHDIAYPRED